MSKFDNYDSTVIGADGSFGYDPIGAHEDALIIGGWDGGNEVGSYYDIGEDDIGDDIDGDDIDGDEVGRRAGRRRAERKMARNPPSVAAIERAARARGMTLAPINPNQTGKGGMTLPFGQKLMPTGQRRLPCGFVPALGRVASSSWAVTANVQRGFQAERFILNAYVASSGADARGFINITDLRVNNRTQTVAAGSLSPELFSALAFDVGFELDPAGSGNIIEMSGVVTADAPSAINLFLSAVGKASR